MVVVWTVPSVVECRVEGGGRTEVAATSVLVVVTGPTEVAVSSLVVVVAVSSVVIAVVVAVAAVFAEVTSKPNRAEDA